MKFNFLLFLSLATMLYSCGSVNAQKESTIRHDTLSCIQQKIEAYKKQPLTNPPMSVYQYNYNGQVVYFVSAPCCDRYSVVYDKECNVICHPSGGITGRGDGKCADFFTARTDEKLLWKDERKPK
jgi:hypothetical protein